MSKLKQKRGFTLLEIIVVIIIIGVLASLAMPRFFRTVEYSRGMEALTHLSALRSAMERCYLISNSFTPCSSFANLDVDNPTTLTGTHFTYTLTPPPGTTTFTVTAWRNTLDGGVNTNFILIAQDGGKSGSGAFQNVR